MRAGSDVSELLNDFGCRRFITRGEMKASKWALIGKMQRVVSLSLAPLQGTLIICCTKRELIDAASQEHNHVPEDQ